MQRPRRQPRFARIIGTAAVVGLLLGAAYALVGASGPTYSINTQLGYFGLLGAALGALVGGVIAVLLDRDR